MESNQEQAQEFAKQYGQLVAKAWADDSFKARLLAEPAAVLQEEGIAVPAGVELRAVENTDKVMYLTLPPKPSEDLSDEQLNSVAGGLTAGSSSTMVLLSLITSRLFVLASVRLPFIESSVSHCRHPGKRGLAGDEELITRLISAYQDYDP